MDDDPALRWKFGGGTVPSFAASTGRAEARMRRHLGRTLAVVFLVTGFILGTVVLALSETTYKDPCPPDRDLFAFSLTSDGTTYASISEAVSVVASENGYGELSTSERESIEEASQAAAVEADTLTVEPDLPDSDIAADLVVTLDRTGDGTYVPTGGSYCAKVVNG